ncbi:MAG: hypothetical protein CVU06_10865 [Bacteroidetes bacterium HGW-Bacteroidetes-22]|nr:MAG: hypothetical protein CVU06_10865 [Bacteroidetes bacterium HGW-Bacteroidetes-22]
MLLFINTVHQVFNNLHRCETLVINLIGATSTNTGLTVKANLDEKIYKTGIKITEQEKQSLNIKRNDFHGRWNYRISPNL